MTGQKLALTPCVVVPLERRLTAEICPPSRDGAHTVNVQELVLSSETAHLWKKHNAEMFPLQFSMSEQRIYETMENNSELSMA